MKKSFFAVACIITFIMGLFFIACQKEEPGTAAGGYGEKPAAGGYGEKPAAGGYGEKPAAGGYGGQSK